MIKNVIIIVLLIVIACLGIELYNSNSNLEFTEGTTSNKSSEYSDKELVQMVKDYLNSKGAHVPEYIEITEEKDNMVTIHLYDDFEDHVTTTDWYEIDRSTGKGSSKVSSKSIDLNERTEYSNYIANTTVPNPEKIFGVQIPLINYTIEYLSGSVDGLDCKKIEYTEYSKLLLENGFKFGENLSDNNELYMPSDSFYIQTNKNKFFRYYDNNGKYIIDLRVDENNYINAIKIITDDSNQGN